MKPKAHQEYKWLSSSSSTIIIITITITDIIGATGPGSLSGRAMMVIAGTTTIIITIIIITATGAIATNIDHKAAGPGSAAFILFVF
jgi:hypothetical protein